MSCPVPAPPKRSCCLPPRGLWLALFVAVAGYLRLPAASGISNLYQLDPLCLLPAAGKSTLDPGNPPVPNRRMAERLAAFRDNHDPQGLFFRSDLFARFLDNRWDHSTNPIQRLDVGIALGQVLAQAGRPDSALNTYAAMEAILANGIELPPQRRAQLRMRKAIAFLRMGEQENCIARHGPESCLFPLSPAAVHLLPRGSTAAIQLLEEQLREIPGDLTARWLLNIAYMTLGQYPDRVPKEWVIPPSTFASEHPLPRFPEIAGSAGLDVNDLGGGSIVDDFDNDGLLDVVASSWGLDGPLRFFHNTGQARFEERTSQAGLVGLNGGLNLLQADYNNDGRLDFLVLRGAWLERFGRIPNSLLRNDGNGTFTDVTESAGLLSFHPTQTAVWFDFDADGWLDLFIGNETSNPADPDPCELFRNNRDGTFTECAARVGLDVRAYVKGVTSGDFDNDGRSDLYLSVRNGPNRLFRNTGPAGEGPSTNIWTFTDVTARAQVENPVFSFPTWFFDYDNDGWMDLYVGGYGINGVGDIAASYLGLPSKGALPRLYRNNRDGTFANVTQTTGLGRIGHAMGCNFGDLDNDGWLDFYLATGDPDLSTIVPNRMFRNAEGKRFQEVSTATGTGHLQKGHGVSFADLDNDGDQDVYVVMGGAFPGDGAHNCLFLNPGSTNHWLHLRLVGTRSNRSAIGARVHLVLQTPSGERHLHRTVGSGASFGANPLRLELGLGNATRIQLLEINWPGSGSRQSFTNIPLDQAFTFTEDAPQPTPLPLRRVPLTAQAGR